MNFVGMVCSLGLIALGIVCILLRKTIDSLEERLEQMELYLTAKYAAEGFMRLRQSLTRNNEVFTHGFKETEIH